MITIIAKFETKPECAEAFREIAAPCVEASRKEEGNVSYNLYAGKEDKNRFFFIEVWKDEEAIAFHNTTDHFKAFAGAFPPLITGTPAVELCVEA